MLAGRQLPEVPVILVEGRFMFLSETKLSVRQFLAAQYPLDIEEALVGAVEVHFVSIHSNFESLTVNYV